MLKPRYPFAIPIAFFILGIAIAMLMYAKLRLALYDPDFAQNIANSAYGALGGGLAVLVGAFDPKWQYRMRKRRTEGDGNSR
jgi:hypothetical protein